MMCSKWWDVGDLIDARLIVLHKRSDRSDIIDDDEYSTIALLFRGTSIRAQVCALYTPLVKQSSDPMYYTSRKCV